MKKWNLPLVAVIIWFVAFITGVWANYGTNEGIFSIGRAGSYLYGIDIDDCIRQSMLMIEMIKQGGQDDSPVPGIEYRFPELNKI